jgi:hypothetical protein
MRNDDTPDTPRPCSRCGLAPRRAPGQRWCHACAAADQAQRRHDAAAELRFLRDFVNYTKRKDAEATKERGA